MAQVGIFFSRFRRWLRPPRQLRFTREGKYFVGITFGVGFAAINTGNNLLYLLLGMMLSFIIASGILSEMSLRDLEVIRQPPTKIFSKQPFLMGIGLRNNKKKIPSFSVEVEDLIDGSPIDKKCYFLKVPAGRIQYTSYRHQFLMRGLYTFTAFRISTKFPFALFRKSRLLDIHSQIVVLPELIAIARPAPPRTSVFGGQLSPRNGRQGDFLSLRQYRDGDDPRDIHWRSSARRQRWMIREHEEEASRFVNIVLDNGLPQGADCSDEVLRAQLERAIAQVAYLTVACTAELFTVRIATRGEALWTSSNAAQTLSVLRSLAVLGPRRPDVPLPLFPDRQSAITLGAGLGASGRGLAVQPT